MEFTAVIKEKPSTERVRLRVSHPDMEKWLSEVNFKLRESVFRVTGIPQIPKGTMPSLPDDPQDAAQKILFLYKD